MYKLLIADASEPYTDALSDIFRHEFELKICHDGETALEMLLSFTPDILILNLMLPFKDGLTILQESAHRPRVILAVTPYANSYIEQTAINLGVQYIMIMPTVNSLRVRLMDMIANTISPTPDLSAQTIIHLHALGFQTHLDGYRQLCIGLPLFAAATGMRLSKELYPAIAEHLGNLDARSVEHSIRKSITNAWSQRDPVIWAKYFPGHTGEHLCPTNKEFLSRIAEILEIPQTI